MEILGFLRKTTLLALAVMCGLVLPLSSARSADQIQLYEQKIKAGLVYNFLKYTTWPAGSGAASNNEIHVCLYGHNVLDGYLAPLDGKTAQQSVIVISQVSQPRDMDRCDVVFIDKGQQASLASILDYLNGKHVLTLSDIQQFSRMGGMIELAKEDQKIDLYINTTTVSHAGLNIQDRLLKLAKLVSG